MVLWIFCWSFLYCTSSYAMVLGCQTVLLLVSIYYMVKTSENFNPSDYSPFKNLKNKPLNTYTLIYLKTKKEPLFIEASYEFYFVYIN